MAQCPMSIYVYTGCTVLVNLFLYSYFFFSFFDPQALLPQTVKPNTNPHLYCRTIEPDLTR